MVSIQHVLELGQKLKKLIFIGLVPSTDDDLGLLVFGMRCFILLCDLFMGFHLLNPADVRLMVNKIDNLA